MMYNIIMKKLIKEHNYSDFELEKQYGYNCNSM